MSKFRLALTALVVTSTLALGSSVNATSTMHTNYLTFSAPVALPGVTLAAGTYVFESSIASSRDLVRVTSRDGRQTYFTAFTRMVDRPGKNTSAAVVFGEAPSGTTPPVRIWYPVGQRVGHEFIY